MNLRIRCAKHNQVLTIFSSYNNNVETIIDVVPCPECAAQHSVQRIGDGLCANCGESKTLVVCKECLNELVANR